MGAIFNSGDEGASDSNAAAVKALQGLQTPDVEAMRVSLQRQVQQGLISPEDAEAVIVQQTEMANVSTDPRLRQAQMAALGGLQETVDTQGMSAADRYAMQQIQDQSAQQERGQRASILQNAQQRGVAGSGLELASQMQNQQESASRAANQGFAVAAQAQQAKLQALNQLGTLGGNIQGQDFSQQAQIAAAKDAISKFNATNQQNQMNLNVGARNEAQLANLQNKQNIANANVDIANTQESVNKGLTQQDFENQYKKAGGVATAFQNQAEMQNKQAIEKRKSTDQLIGTGVSAAAMFTPAGAGAKAFSDKNVKTNIEPFDAASFLDNITGYKYNYKKPEMGKGEQVGVMAQDIEKGAPQAVSNTPEGKVVDYNKLGGPILAALASVNERLNKVEGK